MRKRIQRLALGKFEHDEPNLTLSTDKIEIDVLEGQQYTGEFLITVTNHMPIKGIVYTSNPYMECLTPEFEGEEIRIQFQFHSKGFIEGDIQKGDFYIICNQVEYNLSFVVSVHKLYADSGQGKIRSLHDFVKLAQNSLEQAHRLFVSPVFKNILKEENGREKLLFEGLGKTGASLQSMEEFLIAANLKQQIHFELQEKKKQLSDIAEEEKEILNVKKDGWGYLQFTAASDAECITLEKQHYETEDFVGSVCGIAYYIDADKLHAGKNYACITLENVYQKEQYHITIAVTKKEQEGSSTHIEIQRTLAVLTQLYLDYRLKKIGVSLWAARMAENVNHLIALSPESLWYPLMKAQAMIVSGQKQEAEWLLEDFKRKAVDKTDAAYAYYLYLCTLWEREESYVNRLTIQIEEIYHKTGDERIFWMLLFLKEEYCTNDTLRIRAIEAKMQEGCTSPFFYIEAYYLYWQRPYLLTRLTEFEIRILYWAAGKNALTHELALQITTLSSTKRVFEPLLFKTMCFAYDKYEQLEMLTAICAYLIRSQRFDAHYHIWFDRGVREDLRIAGLNEAYLMSMDLLEVKKIPRMIQMYFQYNSNVPYKQKAALFANIIAAKEEEPDVYHNYRKLMEQFALMQVEEGHIDDNLAIVYSDLLDKGMIQKQMAEPLAKILYTHKMNCFTKKLIRMYVLHRQLKQIQSIPIINGTAYFQLYSDDYAILFEDEKGERYAQGVAYQIEKLMRPGIYYRNCMIYAPCEISYLLYHFSKREKSRTFIPEDSEYLNQLIGHDAVKEEYRAVLYPEAVRYYERLGDTQRVCDYLRDADVSYMKREDRIFIIEQLAEYGLYDLAYQYMQEYGTEGIRPERMVAVCGYEIEQIDYESDDFLITICEKTFLEGKYSEALLKYLAQYYCGPTKNMALIWNAAKQFEVNTYELEERLLVQMLYTTEFVDQVQKIYDSYVQTGAVRILQQAYVNYFAYLYFVKQAIIPDEVIVSMKDSFLHQEEMSTVMKLALLYAIAKDDIVLEKEEKHQIAETLLSECLSAHMYFAFFGELEDELRYQFHLYDRQFAEYRTSPQKRVTIHYQKENSFVEEEMTEMFEGIFVKEFIVFFGEEIPYYISEEDGSKKAVTQSSSISNHDVCERETFSRYDMLNAMQLQLTLKEYDKLKTLMRRYESLQRKNEDVYHIM